MAITEEEEEQQKDTTNNNNNNRISKESILQDAIDEIHKLEKGLKSAKTLGDILVLTYNMPLTLMAVGLQLDLFKSWLQHEGVLQRDLTIDDLP
jgi:hypothetical protein